MYSNRAAMHFLCSQKIRKEISRSFSTASGSSSSPARNWYVSIPQRSPLFLGSASIRNRVEVLRDW